MANASNLRSLLLDFQTDIRAMALDDIPSEQVYVRKFPTDRGLVFPCALIFPQTERVRPWNNASIDVGYGVGIVMAQVSNEELELDDNAARLLRWRMRLIRRYTEHGSDALTTVTTLHQTQVEPGPVIAQASFRKNYDVTSLLIRCWVIEPDTQP